MPQIAIETLKANGHQLEEINLPIIFRQWMSDKGFDTGKLKRFYYAYPQIGELLQFLTRSTNGIVLKTAFRQALDLQPTDRNKYHGSTVQNQLVDLALSGNPQLRSEQQIFVGRGVSNKFNPPSGLSELPDEMRHTPILVIGGGAAGIFVHYMLVQVFGFRNVKWVEKRAKHGIWSQRNVNTGSRNNPLDLTFAGRTLKKAPGSGLEVEEYLQYFTYNFSAPATGRTIKSLRSVNGLYKVEYTDREPEEYDIVVNCSGLGPPRPISDYRRMIVNFEGQNGCQRWQQALSRGDIRGKRLLLVGLGNSTAEMLVNIQEYQRIGVECDYRVITHYPKDAIYNPDSTVLYKGRQYRVFRDLSMPNLVDFHGDLPQFREAYFDALYNGKIISNVKSWSLPDSHDISRTAARSVTINGKRYLGVFDSIYALLGYQHTPSTLNAINIGLHKDYPLSDYDGEFHAPFDTEGRGLPAQSRLSKGYFGFGAILDSPWNPNSIVIPGMLFRLPDLMVTLLLRAAELAVEKRGL